MRAVGVLCLQLFDEGKSPEIKDELKKISTDDYARLDWGKGPKESLYGWYYATQCMFQKQGVSWQKWNRKFQAVLIKNQHKEGYWQYTPSGGHYESAGDDLSKKVYATTLCSLMLTVYYRYLPSTGLGFTVKGHDEKDDAGDDEAVDLL